jgi:hypothetical protein
VSKEKILSAKDAEDAENAGVLDSFKARQFLEHVSLKNRFHLATIHFEVHRHFPRPLRLLRKMFL